MPSSLVNIQFSFATLPEGWTGTPEEFKQWLADHATITAEGAFLIGSTSGVEPSSDVGLWINGRQISVWEEDKYVPILTVPIGVILDYASPSGEVPDENWLLCDGALHLITDFPDLHDVIGRTYSGAADDELRFRVPDCRGRLSIGAGTGEYYPIDPSHATLSGAMQERNVGEYFGYEWPSHALNYPSGAPSPRFSATLKGTEGTNPDYKWTKATFNTVERPTVVLQKIIRAK